MSRQTSTKDLLRRLVPMDSLSDESLEKLAAKAVVQRMPAGKVLFKAGDRDQDGYYVIKGEVRLTNAEGKTRTVVAGTPDAGHALAPHTPRQLTATTGAESEILKVDNELLDILLTWDQSAGYVVEEISPGAEVGDDADWMTRMLRSNIFYRIPPANIHAILTRMESVRVRAGETVIEQGSEGDYFYIIKSGCAEVIRHSSRGPDARLAEKVVGDGFGEEALLSAGKRNASVVMKTEGELMRLAKKDFEELLRAPVLQQIEFDKADALVEAGRAVWVDVRLESEFANDHVPGAYNVPLFLLRLLAKRLPTDQALVVYCDTGRRSSAAAYLLSERGFDVYVLQGGYAAKDMSQVA